jgi:hypothetical protein
VHCHPAPDEFVGMVEHLTRYEITQTLEFGFSVSGLDRGVAYLGEPADCADYLDDLLLGKVTDLLLRFILVAHTVGVV